MIWLEVKYAPEAVAVEGGEHYSIKGEVLNASGIEREVFVYRLVDDVFMHVASAYDMNVYPPSRARALGERAEFYRASEVRTVFTTSARAAAALRSYKARLKNLVTQWKATRTENLGDTEVEVYTAD